MWKNSGPSEPTTSPARCFPGTPVSLSTASCFHVNREFDVLVADLLAERSKSVCEEVRTPAQFLSVLQSPHHTKATIIPLAVKMFSLLHLHRHSTSFVSAEPICGAEEDSVHTAQAPKDECTLQFPLFFDDLCDQCARPSIKNSTASIDAFAVPKFEGSVYVQDDGTEQLCEYELGASVMETSAQCT